MSLWSRLANAFRENRLDGEIDEEFAAHLEEAAACGRDPGEARRAFGSALRYREASRDARMNAWMASLRSDALFGLRQLRKHGIASIAIILSLGLAIGSCTAAFRIIDALLLRPMPVGDPDRLYAVAITGGAVAGAPQEWDSCSYPMFERMRDVASAQADLVAVSYMDWADVSYGSDQDLEKAHLQFVSGRMFALFGLRSALGRVFGADEDVKSGNHPDAVLSFDYWTRRFARDARVIGRTLKRGDRVFEIAGVAPPDFTGTETGTVTDVFLPITMTSASQLVSPENFWLRTFVKLKPGVLPDTVHERLADTFRQIQTERARSFLNVTPSQLRRHFEQRLLLEPAGAGRSNLQRDYGRSLAALAILVALVLLIACANASNLMTARALARAKEMALRVSIGAGRGRLIQLVIVECAWIACLATAIGAVFAWWSAPFIVRSIQPAEDPVRLALSGGWRILAFGAALAAVVTVLFGVAPALRASGVKPAGALKGEDPHYRGRTMNALAAIQVTFCFIVLFVAGLFITSFGRLTDQPTGFSAARVINLETITTRPQPGVFWDQIADRLRSVPGIESVALTTWPMMSGESSNGPVSIDGQRPAEVLSDFLSVSPGWIETMKISILGGRDFRLADTNPGVAMVNRAFAREYFDGHDPVGRWFERVNAKSARTRIQIVGLIADARSRNNVRMPIRPTVYVPFQDADESGAMKPKSRGTFVVRTAGADPIALAPVLRRTVSDWPGFHVSNIRTQDEIIRSHTIRERLLAMLGVFFAGVALVLAGVGLYGVLDYSVVQRRREIGIRIAIGASRSHVAHRLMKQIALVSASGGVAGFVFGIAAARYVASLLYSVNATDPARLALPASAIALISLAASIPALIRALQIDPAEMLRLE